MYKRLKNLSGCSAVGSAQDWGSWGRWFKSSHSDHKETESSVSFFYCKNLLIIVQYDQYNCVYERTTWQKDTRLLWRYCLLRCFV